MLQMCGWWQMKGLGGELPNPEFGGLGLSHFGVFEMLKNCCNLQEKRI